MQCIQLNTDDTLRETRAHGDLRAPFAFYRDEYRSPEAAAVEWHWHRECELVYLEQGALECRVGCARIALHAGEGLWIASGALHRFATESAAVMPNLLFLPEWIAPEGSLIHEQLIAPLTRASLSHCTLNADMLDCAREIVAVCDGDAPTRALDLLAAVSRFWSLLYRERAQIETMESSGAAMRTQARLRLMIEFIEAHLCERLCLDDIAQAAGISRSEALRCFQSIARRSPIDYLNHLRLLRARQMLISGEQRVTEIAAEVGFENPSYFDRLFRREFGVTPVALRRQRAKAAQNAANAR